MLCCVIVDDEPLAREGLSHSRFSSTGCIIQLRHEAPASNIF
ncbi:hypothetical protein SAMN05443550_101311 [Pedobacter hartonius]|uniref:Uncharacterized protein n=1 Tax=Pedobacter hartonius TaxID=425514 RepID=A0A1H3WMV1_9SPHI|nr:hypothetical protein SAMN05443550_101311 [Pedobacter hartonius]